MHDTFTWIVNSEQNFTIQYFLSVHVVKNERLAIYTIHNYI